MIDIKKLTQQKTELKEVWDYLAINAPFPDKQVRLWLLDYEKDMIESAFKVLAEKEEKVDDAVKYLAGILRNSKERNMTPEQREEQISLMRSVVGKIGAAKAHAKEIAYIKDEFAKVCSDLPEVCETLPEVAKGLQNFGGSDCVGVGVGVSVCVSDGEGDSGGNRNTPNPVAPSPLPPSPRREEKGNTQTKTNGSGASGVSANQRQDKVKIIKTARGEKPKPDGFDTWTNVERTEWIACTLDCYESGWNFEHMTGCAACGQTQAKSAAAGESLTSENQIKYGNKLGVPEL